MPRVLVTGDHVLNIDTDSRLETDIQAGLDLHRQDHLLVGVLHIDVAVGTMEYLHGTASSRQVLDDVGARLDRAIRSTDTSAHIAYGQFVVVLPGMGTEGDLRMVAEGLIRALSAP